MDTTIIHENDNDFDHATMANASKYQKDSSQGRDVTASKQVSFDENQTATLPKRSGRLAARKAKKSANSTMMSDPNSEEKHEQQYTCDTTEAKEDDHEDNSSRPSKKRMLDEITGDQTTDMQNGTGSPLQPQVLDLDFNKKLKLTEHSEGYEEDQKQPNLDSANEAQPSGDTPFVKKFLEAFGSFFKRLFHGNQDGVEIRDSDVEQLMEDSINDHHQQEKLREEELKDSNISSDLQPTNVPKFPIDEGDNLTQIQQEMSYNEDQEANQEHHSQKDQVEENKEVNQDQLQPSSDSQMIEMQAVSQDQISDAIPHHQQQEEQPIEEAIQVEGLQQQDSLPEENDAAEHGPAQ